MENNLDPQDLRGLLDYAANEALTRANDFEIPRHIPPVFERHVGSVESAFIGIFPFLKKCLIILATTTFLLFSSALLYGLFYLAVMPGKVASEPLYFDYSGISSHPAQICFDSTREDTNLLPLNGPSERFPWAVADFFSKHTQWEAFHPDVIPKAITDRGILRGGQGYYFEVVLDLPESEVNLRGGMFGVQVELQSSTGQKLASSMRAVRMPHETLWITTIRKIIWLVPLLVGAVQENRRILVPAFRHFVESSSQPMKFATVRLIRHDSQLHVSPPIEVTSGAISVGKELSDFQFFLREWFFTCYIAGTAIIFVTNLVVLLLFRFYLDYRQKTRMHEDPSLGLSLEGSQLGNDLDDDGTNDWEDLPQAHAVAENDQQPTGETAPSDSGNGQETAVKADDIEDTASQETPSLQIEYADTTTFENDGSALTRHE